MVDLRAKSSEYPGELMSTDSLPSKVSPERPSKFSSNHTSRRNFLCTTAVATAAGLAYPALGSARVVDSPPASSVTDSTKKDDFTKGFELDEITIDEARKDVESGRHS